VTVSLDAGVASNTAAPASMHGRRSVTKTAERFTAAYRDYAPRVLGYLRARGVEDPEAITQEVFLALYGRIDSVSGGDDGLGSLIFSIAHARLVDQFRAAARRPSTWSYEPDLDLRTTESAEDRVVRAAGDLGAWQLLSELPDEYREVISLRVIAGLSLAETAEVMGRSDGAVKQLQRRALEKLRARVTVRNDDE
jgi:RNA polymerase sigma-70 factor (ECF subfamily)